MVLRSDNGWLATVVLLVACRSAEHADVAVTPRTSEPTAMPAPAPQAPSQAASAEAPSKLVVTITLDGIVFVGSRQADDDAIVAAARERAVDPSTRIYFDSDDRADFYHVVRVLDLMKQGGIDKFAFLSRHAGRVEMLPLDLPRAADILPPVEGGSFEQHVVIGVEARADGSAMVDGRPLRQEALAPYVRSVISKDPKARAVLRVNRGATYAHVTALYRLLREGGAIHLALAVEPRP
ncbi:MAG TPA: biopolymer transporter ExbD [Polyangiaceae bacterium]|nr:biopolymer transporter ExbD [Polyangiaceae bacterium]